MTPTPRILNLGDQPAIFGFNLFCPTRQAFFCVRIPGPYAGCNFLMGRNRQGFRDQHRSAATGAIQMVLNQTIGRPPVRTRHSRH